MTEKPKEREEADVEIVEAMSDPPVQVKEDKKSLKLYEWAIMKESKKKRMTNQTNHLK